MSAPLLLAHGAAGTIRANFGPLISTLSPSITAFGPDFPGSGDTPRTTGPLRLDDLADHLVASAAGIETFAVLGYSMGCAVAVRAAVRYPERVTALVLTAGTPRADAETRGRIEQWRRLADGDRLELARFVVSVMFSEAFLGSLTEGQVESLCEFAALTMPDGASDQVDLVRHLDVTGDLAHVAVPTLVIGTMRDRLVTPASMRAYADGISGARWAELDSGHLPAVEASGQWARLVEQFHAEIRWDELDR
ncbi:MAG TPA: alpha/beta hydrolase [Mycobacteriales bacterium]|jgi:Predicted hydrolases or acyltransferases (alpha/beta hydrolase superfamily)